MNSPFFQSLRAEIEKHGGMRNAHLHLCRSGTLQLTEQLLAAQKLESHSHLSISTKHGIIPLIHNSRDYDEDRIAQRVRFFLDEMVACGTTIAETLVDVTDDRVGLSGFEVMERLKAEYKGRLDLRLGAYSPLGFRDDEPRRWELVCAAAERADFIGGLPERDDHRLYPDHIGFNESCRRVLALAAKHGVPLHIHVDQKNDPAEGATERVLDVMEEMDFPKAKGEPQVWFIHFISASAYEDEAFDALARRMAAHNAGVICCPSAAISMRQLRLLKTPTHNSIARVLELLAEGVQVRVGSDNINDITSPAGVADLMAEMFVLCNAIRYYDIGVLARLAAGVAITPAQRAEIRQHLDNDLQEIRNSIAVTRK